MKPAISMLRSAATRFRLTMFRVACVVANWGSFL